jgi:hypothetical protein
VIGVDDNSSVIKIAGMWRKNAEDKMDVESFRMCSKEEHTGKWSNVLTLFGIRVAPVDY